VTQFVVDASVVISYLLGGDGHASAASFLTRNPDLIAPPVFLPEVLGRIAGERNGGLVTPLEAEEATRVFVDYLGVDIRPFPIDYDTVPRLSELGQNLALTDATYVLLGEVSGAPVITQDSQMVKAAGKVSGHQVRLP
jgi:predicted nucleic acid-binding protein